MDVRSDVRLSKSLSWLLRHGCETYGLQLLPGGFLYLDDILSLKGFSKYSRDDILRVVRNNSKQRFSLDQDDFAWKIRANQGHSLKVENLELVPITSVDEAPIVIHGTSLSAWDSIKTQGLKRMTRNHIHCAPGEPGADGVISGMRNSCQVWIYIDISKALSDGIPFYRSSNHVILSPGDSTGKIDPYYFKVVKDVTRPRCHKPLVFERIRLASVTPLDREPSVKVTDSMDDQLTEEVTDIVQCIDNLKIT